MVVFGCIHRLSLVIIYFFEIKQLGEVRHLIAPNVLHYSYINEWHELFPEAEVRLASSVQKRARKLGMNLDYGHELESQLERRNSFYDI